MLFRSSQHLELLKKYNIDFLFNKDANVANIKDIIPLDIEKFHDNNEITINRLEKLQIKLSYKKYLKIINNRIKFLLTSKQLDNDTSSNLKDDNLINMKDVQINYMDVQVRNQKRKLGNKDIELSYDEFSINPKTKDSLI